MRENRSVRTLLFISLTIWVAVMGMVYYMHMGDTDEELGYFSSDVTFDSESRNYYSVTRNGTKIGYQSETGIPYRHLMIFREDAAMKLGIAGKSREIFTQTTVTVDTLSWRTISFNFNLYAGAHTYSCNGTVQGDSLIIEVKKNAFDRLRTGIFTVDPDVTLPLALPYFMSRCSDDAMRLQVFDPLSFMLDRITIDRRGAETLAIGDSAWTATRYDIMNGDTVSHVWLDHAGAVLKNEGSLFFSGEMGETTVERASDKHVFLLPLETGIGDAMLDTLRLVPNQAIAKPRGVSYLDVRLDGIRAANIDVEASNKEITSVNPVTFIIRRDDLAGVPVEIDLQAVRADSTVLASTDYIEPHDARIRRAAASIAPDETDTLSIAYAINRWVYGNMTPEQGLHIIRSVDILKEKRGGSDEYTKIFAALARSQGIPTYINMGLVYDDGAFRYHSWPSVFADGRWHHLDPCYGQERADATHITLIRGGYEQKIELFRLMRHMAITIREYQS